MIIDKKLMLIIEKHKAPKHYISKKYITPACKICGWGPFEQIHKNENLRGKGGPYHEFTE